MSPFLKACLPMCLLIALPATAADAVTAAVVLRNADAEFEFDDGTRSERRFRRIGVEYWEAVVPHLQAGFSVGYAENEGIDPARPVEAASGNFASLGVRLDAPLNALLSLTGGAEYLLQWDARDLEDVEFRSRSWETRVELGTALRYRYLHAGIGATWRDIDFRETVRGADETVRRASLDESIGGYAALGARTSPSGEIVFRYDAGAEDGWSLRFLQSF